MERKMDYKEVIAKCIKEEKLLQFRSFSYDIANELGMFMYARAKERKYPVAIDIQWNGQQVFHAALEGSAPNNDHWIEKKQKTVKHFLMSSFRMKNIMLDEGRPFEARFHMSEEFYACCGGGFPLTVKGAGIVGVIAVSGLADYEDHDFIVECLKEYLKK